MRPTSRRCSTTWPPSRRCVGRPAGPAGRGGLGPADPRRRLDHRRPGHPPGLLRRRDAAVDHRPGQFRRDAEALAAGGDDYPTGSPPRTGTWPGRAAALVPCRPPAGCWTATPRGRPGRPAAVVRPGHERGLLGHRPDHGDLGPRPGHRRRPRDRAAADRPAAARGRHRHPGPALQLRGQRPARARPSRSGSSSTAPDGQTWTWGPADAADRVTGDALDFCLVVTQRRHRDDTGLVVAGPVATQWMSIAQAFAGPAPAATPAGAPGPRPAPRRPTPARRRPADRTRLPTDPGLAAPPAARPSEPIRIGNSSGFYGDRGAAARDGRGRPDRRPHRRLPGRADHADPVEGPAEGPGRRLRPARSSPSSSRCSAPASTAASRSSTTPAASTRPAWPPSWPRWPNGSACTRRSPT